MSEAVASSLSRNRSRFEAFTRPATELLLREIAAAGHILDLASGTGDPALAFAAALPRARVIASDRVAALLAEARREADARKLENLQTLEADMHDVPLPAASIDCVVSRFGIQFARDVAKVLAEISRLLRPGGNTCHVVWAAPTQPLLCAMLPKHPFVVAEPGPFQFSQPGSLAAALADAGFVDVDEQTHRNEWLWQGSARSFWQFMQETSAEALEHETASEVLVRLEAFECGDVLIFPVEVHCARARKPAGGGSAARSEDHP